MKLVVSVSARRLAIAATLLSSFAAAHAAETMTVVYASGNKVVVNNSANGVDYGYTVAPGDMLATDAGSTAAAGLKVGSVITGGLKGRGSVVDEAAIVKGTVVSLAPPDKMIVKLSGENKEVSVPEKAVGSTRVGDSVDLTLVSVRTSGDNRPISSVKTPPMTGVLAFFQEPNMDQPDSATNLPTYGLLGGLLLMIGFGLKLRRSAAV